ncbi:MAG: D-glycero-beta-D-manno-heptose-7-phosphate kinase [bacterium]
MITISKKRIKKLFSTFRNQKIVVIGDLMLDRYIWGSVSKISPEAPVPVVEVERESHRFGGAANVVNNIKSLGAEVFPIGVLGRDSGGELLTDLFKKKDLSVEGLIYASQRTTTIKTRIIAHNQHVVRIDREIKSAVPENIQEKILNLSEIHLDNADGLILEDYNKGLLTPILIEKIIKIARERGIRILVDPKFDNFFAFKNTTLFKPNRKEIADKLGVKLKTDEDILKAGEKLQQRLNCEAVLITLGEQGMILFDKSKAPLIIPTKAVKVHDVSGAGDTVIAALAVAAAAGADFREAAVIANYAAGIVCGEVGIVPVTYDHLLDIMLRTVDA